MRASLRLSNNHVEHVDLSGRWYPTADGFAYYAPVQFVMDCPDLTTGEADTWVERVWLTWPDGHVAEIPLGPDRYGLAGEGATFTVGPIVVAIPRDGN